MAKLGYEKLKNECNTGIFGFGDTSALNSVEGIIGQERAKKAMEFGLKIKMRGYNIYMSGTTGTGKTTYAKNYISNLAKNEKTPDDWCYVNNFEKHNEPTAINLPAGKGKIFKEDTDILIEEIHSIIPKVFESEDYEKQKTEKIREYQNKRADLLSMLNQNAEKQGFKVKTSNGGIYFLPIIEGKELSEKDYEKLEEEKKKEINERSRNIQNETMDIIRKIKNIDKDTEKEISDWEKSIILSAVSGRLDELIEKYKFSEKVTRFFNNVKENILENLDEFKEDSEVDKKANIFPWMEFKSSVTEKYRVNLLVDNSTTKGAPVIIDFNPTYFDLVGKTEYESGLGTLTTNYKMIKEGLIHKANGGYLILQAKDILSSFQSWDALKRVLKTREIYVGNMREQFSVVAYSTLKPEPIPVDLKVVLIGNEYIYRILREYDEDFQKLFKIKSDFDNEMDRNEESIMQLAHFISGFCMRESSLHFDKSGVSKVVEYSSRLVGNQEKLTTRFNEIAEILAESCAWAELDNKNIVTGIHVTKAISEKVNRSNKYDEKIQELMHNKTIMIDTAGFVVGQINGLSVLDTGDYFFGKPSRITAATYIGEKGIVNIEREVEMSGTSHSKGVLILSGYMGQKFAQEYPLSLTASLTFEQTYGGIDGDSASSAELYALLSGLAEIPINQGIAVTGSVNQKGEIQPIGGVTQKVEGFFELCKYRGLNGNQGVIIPHQNVRNLNLSEEVIDAVKAGRFHIYTVTDIDEGIEILTGIKSGKRNKSGNFPKNSINYLVNKKLHKYAETAVCFGKDDKKSKPIYKNNDDSMFFV